MKKLPEANVSFEDLYEILIVPIRSKLLLTGTELKAFNHSYEPCQPESWQMLLTTILRI